MVGDNTDVSPPDYNYFPFFTPFFELIYHECTQRKWVSYTPKPFYSKKVCPLSFFSP